MIKRTDERTDGHRQTHRRQPLDQTDWTARTLEKATIVCTCFDASLPLTALKLILILQSHRG